MSTTTTRNSYIGPLILVGCLYFIFGFITWLNGTLIPFLKAACELNNFQAYFVTFAFYISYFIMALPSSAILRATGFKKGMSLGLFIMAVGSILFIPAAMQRNYILFLVGLFTQGLGLSILQTATNPYVTILGPSESAASRISMMGIANKVAGILGPLILATILLNNIDNISKKLESIKAGLERQDLLNELAQRIINPYIFITVALAVLAALVLMSPLPELNEETSNPDKIDEAEGESIFHHPYLFLGAIAIFLYVGVEVMAGDTIINYARYLHIPTDAAKFFPSLTLGCMVGGYFLGILLTPRSISQENYLKICTLLALVLTAGLLLTTGATSVFFLASLGLAHAIMWPAIWPMSLKGLGKHTKTGSALLIMGIAGGAILPLIYGKLADKIQNHDAYILLIPCYLYILYFAVKGHKVGYRKIAEKA
jgi:glucose/galactose transporter